MNPEVQEQKRVCVVCGLCITLLGLAACQSRPSASATPTNESEPSSTATLVPSSDAALSLGPYLQSVTTDSIVVAWDTDWPSWGEVVYGETEEYGQSAVGSTVGERHAVTLTGLTPYTVYHYRVQSEGLHLSEDGTFRTAAGPEQTTFDFVVFGDTRTNHAAHRDVVERIVALEPDFVVHTGDLVESGWQKYQWGTFFRIEQELLAQVPFFPALGNHEDDSLLYFDFFHLPGNERWYSFDYGQARFVCLQVDGYGEFGRGSEQTTWLEKTLAANTQPWLFVFFHFPPYSSLSEDPDEVELRAALTPLFERYGVDIVFNGDHHSYQRSEVNGVTYVVTAGGGAPLYEITQADEYLVSAKNDYHATYVTIDGDTLTSVIVTREGEEFDRFTLSH